MKRGECTAGDRGRNRRMIRTVPYMLRHQFDSRGQDQATGMLRASGKPDVLRSHTLTSRPDDGGDGVTATGTHKRWMVPLTPQNWKNNNYIDVARQKNGPGNQICKGYYVYTLQRECAAHAYGPLKSQHAADDDSERSKHHIT